MRKPVFDAEREIVDALSELREDRIVRLARLTKKGRWFIARFVRF